MEEEGRRSMSAEEDRMYTYLMKHRARTRYVPDQMDPDAPQPIPALKVEAEEPEQPGARREEHLATCREVLTEWRKKTWAEQYSTCSFSRNALLEDKDLTVLASRARIRTFDDLKLHVPNWPFMKRHGDEVLTLLRLIDDDYRENRAAQLQVKEEHKAALAAKKARQEAAKVKPIKHPWDVPKGRPRNHFWSYSMRQWLPIPVEYELQCY